MLDLDGSGKKIKNKKAIIIKYSNLALSFKELKVLEKRYDDLELSCAMKSFFTQYVLKKFALPHLCYFDADILITAPLDSVFDNLKLNPILLTPHLLDPRFSMKESRFPNERSILLTGAFNMGFVGVNNSLTAVKFLEWWKKRSFKNCRKDLSRGYFLDQRFIDFVPGLFPEAKILRDKGANVGFWNLHERKIESRKGAYYVGKDRLLFFHFSGFDVKNPSSISKYQTIHSAKKNKALSNLMKTYQHNLVIYAYEAQT